MDSGKPAVSIIIPTYRRPGLLRRAIRSALAQTCRDLQVCVYDNASGDETGRVVAEIARQDPRVRYHCHPVNLGLMGNFNYGMAHVDTPFFSFLSDDDILLPDYVATAVEGFGRCPDAMFSACSTIIATAEKRVMHVPLDAWPREGCYPAPEGLFQMTKGDHPIITTIMYRAEVVKVFGTMDEKVGMPADLDYELKVAARFPIVISKRPSAIFTIHSTSTGASSDYRYSWPSWLTMIENLKADPQLSPETKARAENDLSDQLRRRMIYLGYRSITRRDFGQARAVAKILREHFRMKGRPTIIDIAVSTGEKVPAIYSVLDPVNSLRKTLGKKRSGGLQEKYGPYLRYLDM